ncbi:hypothetical protein [Paenibacillus sp. NRS-1760]|uniref:hypothetical protein n=1 Tax=Paenibacillus sp. NRS-1760 TaxID=3233902 RepID=UPI003D288DD0
MSKEDNTVRKTIGFNIDDPDESADLKHAMKRKNFSRYVKQLIHLDRVQGREGLISARVSITEAPSVQTSHNEEKSQKEVINKSFGSFL